MEAVTDTTQSADSPPTFGIREAWSVAWREHRLLLACIAVYIACGFVIQKMFAFQGMMRLNLYSFPLLLITSAYLFLFLTWFLIRMWRHWDGKQSPRRWMWHGLTSRYLTPLRVIRFLIVYLSLPLFTSTFSSFKQAIPRFKPFCWDHAFMEWDRRLHAGRLPSELLQPMLGAPLITSVINFFYNMWFVAIFTVIIWQAWSENLLNRKQFLWSFVITWSLLGSVMAILLSSGGPCFYHLITGLPDPYAPLLQYLHSAQAHYPVWALSTQEQLWAAYQAGGVHLVGGISAMPSIHVATATLLALAGWNANRWLGIGLTAFAALILIGSIHLGWHYAIDGYFSIPSTLLIWWLCGRGVRWWGGSTNSQVIQPPP